MEEFGSYVVEQRRYHAGSDDAASGIPDVLDYLLRDFGFQSRHRLLRVFKLCCLVISLPQSNPLTVGMELSGCPVDREECECCLRLVQSYVLSAGYTHQTFFGTHTMDNVRSAIVSAGTFLADPSFKLWAKFCRPEYESIVDAERESYVALLAERRKAGSDYYVESNKANRQA